MKKSELIEEVRASAFHYWLQYVYSQEEAWEKTIEEDPRYKFYKQEFDDEWNSLTQSK